MPPKRTGVELAADAPDVQPESASKATKTDTVTNSKTRPTVVPRTEELHPPRSNPNPSVKTSPVWDSFGLHDSYPDWAFCRTCQKWFSYHGTTSNLLHHLEHTCIAPDASQQKLPFTRTKKSPAEEKEAALTDLVVAANLPFSLVDHKEFRRLFKLVDPSFEVPHKTKMTTLVKKAAKEKAEKIATALKAATAIALTTDTATTITQTSMNAVTAHWITDGWDLRSAVIALRELAGSHTGAYLSSVVQEDAKSWGISESTIAITTDGAANALLAAKNLRDADVVDEMVRCWCHLLHLAVTYALEIPEVSGIVDTCKRLVTKFKKSNQLSETLLQLQRLRAAAGPQLNIAGAAQAAGVDDAEGDEAGEVRELDIPAGDERPEVNEQGETQLQEDESEDGTYLLVY